MKPTERREAIVAALIETADCTVEDLAARFDVSKVIIDRDLDELESSGLLRKTEGGASMQPNSLFESDYRYRQTRSIEAKSLIARAATTMVEPGQAVILDDSTTVALMAQHLVDCTPLTVITNNMTVLNHLVGVPGIKLICPGGVYHERFNSFLGLGCEESLRSLRADIGFVSASAVHGTSIFHQSEELVQSKRLMIAAAEECHLLVDHTKFGRSALHHVTDLSAFESVLTDLPPSAEQAAAFESSDAYVWSVESDAPKTET